MTMVQFFTLSTLIGAVALINCVAMCIVWRIQPRMAGLRLWAGAQAAATVAWIPSMFVNLGLLNDPFYTAFNNMLNLGSMILLFEGALRFRAVAGAATRRPWLFVTFAITIVMSLVNREDAAARYLFHDAVAMLLLGGTAAAMLWRTEPYQRLPHFLTAFYVGAQALTFACRWGLAAAVLLGWTDMSAKSLNYAVFGTITLCSLGTLYGLILSINAAARHQVELMGLIDPLTGLDNRRALLLGLERVLAERSRSSGLQGIVYLDLDGFKSINDRYGHAVGDKVLQLVADRLCRSLRIQDQAARMGGDEFVVLLRDLPDAAALDEVAQRLRRAVEGPVPSDLDMDIQIRVSLGIAMAPSQGQEPATLLQQADADMYQDKRGRQNSQMPPPEPIMDRLDDPLPS